MSRGVPSRGDILFTTEAPLGNVCRFPAEGRYAVGQRTVTLRPAEKILNYEYLLYFLLSEKGQRLIDIRSSGSTAKGIKSAELKKIKITLPAALPEQKKIAEILSTWDRAIDATERLSDNSRQRKKALMQQLLTGKKRLPGFEGEWERQPLGVIARVYQPKTISQSSLKENGHPVYGANGLIGFYDDYNHEDEQVAVTCRGSTCGLVNWTKPKSWITGNAMVVNVSDNPQVDKRYLYYILARSSLDYLVTGSGQPQITGDIKRHEILLPSINEQSAVSKIIHKADEEITLLESHLDCLMQEKKALMQQLLTGKRRVNVDTEAA